MSDTKMPTDDELKQKLTPEQYHILREGGTEPAFSGEYWNDHDKAMYACRVCGQELFSSDTKFDSGTGWPSFTDPVNLEHVELRDDSTFGTRLPSPAAQAAGGQVKRTEVICKKCGSHLGHLFDDGPVDKGGKRYCINSACLIKK
jgi:peptide-methionine (R)-S-oxide reductase